MDYSKIKGMFKDIDSIKKDNYAILKLLGFINTISIIEVIIILLIHSGNILQLINIHIVPLLSVQLSSFLYKYTFLLLVCIVIGDAFLSKLIAYGVISIDHTDENYLLAAWRTLEDIFKVFASTVIMLYLLNLLFESFNGDIALDLKNDIVFVLFIYWQLIKCILWIFGKNKDRCSNLMVKYTPFFDVDGTRITVDDYVVYNQKIYKISEDKDESDPLKYKYDWWLTDINGRTIEKVILLKEAVINERGKLKVLK